MYTKFYSQIWRIYNQKSQMIIKNSFYTWILVKLIEIEFLKMSSICFFLYLYFPHPQEAKIKRDYSWKHITYRMMSLQHKSRLSITFQIGSYETIQNIMKIVCNQMNMKIFGETEWYCWSDIFHNNS